MDIDDKDLEKLISDIRFIRKSIQSNIKILREINFSLPVRYSGLFFGASMVIIPSIFYFIIMKYGSIKTVPPLMTLTFLLVLFLSVFFSWLVKFRIYNPLKKIYNERSFIRIIINLIGKEFFMLYLLLLSIIGVVCVFLALFSIPQFIIPAVSIGFGMFLAITGIIMNITEYSISGIWIVITALAGIPLIKIYPRTSLLILGLSPGFGSMIYFIIIQFGIFRGKDF